MLSFQGSGRVLPSPKNSAPQSPTHAAQHADHLLPDFLPDPQSPTTSGSPSGDGPDLAAPDYWDVESDPNPVLQQAFSVSLWDQQQQQQEQGFDSQGIVSSRVKLENSEEGVDHQASVCVPDWMRASTDGPNSGQEGLYFGQ